MQTIFNRFEQYKFMRSLIGGTFVKLRGTVLLTGVDRWFSADQISDDEHFGAEFHVQLNEQSICIFKSSREVLAVQTFV